MRIIISPAKNMREDTDWFSHRQFPMLLAKAERLVAYMQSLSYADMKQIWNCSETLARQNYDRLQKMDVHERLSPALLSYDGLQYRYMAPMVFTEQQWQYVNEHLMILSGLYGVLRADDGIVPYRLEMASPLRVDGCSDLYAYWGSSLYDAVMEGNRDRVIVNLASKEYARAIEPYLQPQDTYITCTFQQKSGDKWIQKAALAKMARGTMVRFMAARDVKTVGELAAFAEMGYRFDRASSSKQHLMFRAE